MLNKNNFKILYIHNDIIDNNDNKNDNNIFYLNSIDNLIIEPFSSQLIKSDIFINNEHNDNNKWNYCILDAENKKSIKNIEIITNKITNKYTGNIIITINNPNNYPIKIKNGDCIAKLIIEGTIIPKISIEYKENYISSLYKLMFERNIGYKINNYM